MKNKPRGLLSACLLLGMATFRPVNPGHLIPRYFIPPANKLATVFTRRDLFIKIFRTANLFILSWIYIYLVLENLKSLKQLVRH